MSASSSQPSPSASQTTPIYPSHGLGVHEYNGAGVAFFCITGLILQFPVLYAHCGIYSRPNVPVVMMSLYYAYTMLSASITAVSWSAADTSHWWSGSGWCDFAVRMYLASSLGVLSTQCVINWNILEMLGDRPRVTSGRSALMRGLIELAACSFLPVLSLAVSTFTMYQRYDVMQDLGCLPNLDSSAAVIVTYYMWLPALGSVILFMMVLIIYRFLRRGRAATMEAVSFIPNMSVSQFSRIIVFSAVVAGILVPLSITVSVVNFINIGRVGISPIAWASGKPDQWDNVQAVSMSEYGMVANAIMRAAIIVDFVVCYVNIAIAWLLFFCYGTGTVALQAYRKTFRKLFSVTKGSTHTKDSLYSNYDDDTVYSGSPRKSPAHLSEWDGSFDGHMALWEQDTNSSAEMGENHSTLRLPSSRFVVEAPSLDRQTPHGIGKLLGRDGGLFFNGRETLRN